MGPISRVRAMRLTWSTTGIMSCCGMRSVMQTIRSIPACAPSRIESAAKRGGTVTKCAVAPVAAAASATVSKIGTPWAPSGDVHVWPPLPGVTPATTCVP